MEYGPQIVPSTSFRKRAAPFRRVEVLRPAAILVPSLHEAGRGIEHVPVVIDLTAEDVLVIAVAGHLGELVSTPIIVRIFKGLGGRFPHIRIRDVTQREIFLPAVAPAGGSAGAVVGRLMIISGERLVRVEGADAFRPGVGEQRDGVTTNHTAVLIGERPRGKPAELLVAIEHRVHIAALHRGMQDAGQRELGPECIPKTGVRIIIAGVDLVVVRAPVVGIALGVILEERAGEDARTEEARIEGLQVLLIIIFHEYAAE